MNDSSFERDGDHVAPGIEPGRLTRADLVRRAAVAGVAVPAAAWAATGARNAEAATRKGGTLRVAMIKPGAAIDPVSGFDFGSIATGQMVAEYLAWVEPGGHLRPVLATSWHSDATAKKWTFKLRPGVHFSNGRPLTATDVVATFDRLTSPKIANATLKGILSHGKTKRVDDHTVVFNLDRPFVDFPTLVAVSNYNAVILPADWPGDFEKNPIGTGPFLLDQIVPGQSVSFKRNPNYWRKGLPLLDGVLFRFYAENQPQVLALQGGDVDMMIETPFQGSQALFNNPKITILSATSASHRALHMRVDKEPWTDKRVRQALALTIDRDKLVQALFAGKAVPGNDHIFSPAFGVRVHVPKRRQNYAKSK